MSRAALFVALLLAAAGCRTAPTRLPLAEGDPRPAALLRAWQEGADARRALRGSARLAVDGEGPPIRSRQILVVERPSRLRVEVQGLLSQTLAVLVTDGPRFQLFRAEDRSFEAGEVRPGLLWQVASLDLTPEEAIDLVLGAPQLDPALAPARAYTEAGGEIGVDLADPAGRVRERRVFDAQGRLRRVERLAEDGEVAWSASFDEYQPVDGVAFAHAIRVEAAPRETRAELVLSGVELNPVLPADIFQLRPAQAGGRADGEGK
ncbi:MAG TPA: hypothetical protein VII72_21660 [Myxococcota bacterium]